MESRVHNAERRREDVVVRALVEVANRCGDVEHAARVPGEYRGDEDDESKSMRLVHDHGFDVARLTAFRGLARSRDVALEAVLRAALRGDLRTIVELRAVPQAEQERGG